MGLLRVMKKTLVVLVFICMTLKIQLELRVLKSGRYLGGYTPWWGNETLGHLRAFPKLATRTNVTLDVLRNANIGDQNLRTKKKGHVLRSSLFASALKASSRNLTRVSHLKGKKKDSTSSYRKILSDSTNINNIVLVSSSDIVSRISHDIEFNATATKSPSNHKTRTGIFAKLIIYDGENTIDTDTIYNSKKRRNVNESPNNQGKTKSISQNSKKIETTTSANKNQVPITQTTNKKKSITGLLKSIVPLPKIGTASKSVQKKVNTSVSHDVDKNEMSLTKEMIAAIKKELKQENEKQTVYNEEKFGPVFSNTTILLVQVSFSLNHHRTFSLTLATKI